MNRKFYIKAISLLSAVLVVLGIFYCVSVSLLKTLYPLRYDEFVERYTEEYELDKSFVYAVIKCESGFDKDAVSYLGARGLMQLMPETFLWLLTKTGEAYTEDDLFNPQVNIKYGCLYYRMMKDEFQSTATAVAAYHAGSANVKKWLSDKRYSYDEEELYEIPFETTKKYVEKVIKTQNIYKKIYKLTEE